MTGAAARPDRWATFDCYGTLVDWETGISGVFAELWPAEDVAALLGAFHAVEPLLQREGTISYREVLTRALPEVAAARGLLVPAGGGTALADSLPGWPPFVEAGDALAAIAAAGWRIGVLSNTDADYLEASMAALRATVDVRVVASQIGSYKPKPRHWEEFRRRSGAAPGRHVHVAASLFHDIAPCAELGIPAVWVNRAGEEAELPRAAEVADLHPLAGVLETLVPA